MKPKRRAPEADPKPAQLPPSLRRYLYFTAAITGAAVMIVEILGAKMLAPFLGTSHFVWTAQIAVTLLALAAGYFVGGKLVDRSPDLGRVYWAILLAAVYLGLAVLVVQPVANWCLDYKLAMGSLMASVFLFFTPLALLAMVGPFFVRALTANISDTGGNVGRLTAVSTLGSFVGTILIGYVLIPFLPNSVTMYVTAGALMAVAVGYFLIWGRKQNPPVAVAALTILGLVLGGIGVGQEQPVQGKNYHEVFRANSNFGRVQVLEWDNAAHRVYLNDLLDQNAYDPKTHQSTDAFTYMLHDLPRAYHTNIQNVLCIGLGCGIVPMQFAREGAQVDVVEINPAVAPIAAQYFDLDVSQIHLSIDDGRHFLNRTSARYDAIVLDAFLGDSSPSHLLSREAFTAMRAALKPGGVLVMNTFGLLRPGTDFFSASVDQTLRTVFRNVRIHCLPGGGNMYFVASDAGSLEIGNWPDLVAVHPACREKVRQSREDTWQTEPSHGRLLTDDYNPLEYYDAANREMIRKAQANTWRSAW